MAAKVPKFGAWEGGENFTVYFDNARKVKNNGQMINPNDPEDNPAMFPPTPSRVESQGQQSKVPQFGAWDKGDNVGYTMYFENARKTKPGGPPVPTEPKPHKAQSQAQAQAQARPTKIKPVPQEPRAKVPQFGGWESGGEVAYTMCFDDVRKNKNGPPNNAKQPSNEPQMNRDMGPRAAANEPPLAHEARTKVPQFGGWNGEGENVAYTACFDNARKNKGGGPGPGPVSVEPQLNRDVVPTTKPRTGQRSSKEDGHVRNASRVSVGSMAGSERYQGRQTPGGQSPFHLRAGKTQLKQTSQGNQNAEQVATIPQFGVWNNNNKEPQTEGFTGAFEKAKEDKRTPLHPKAPQPYIRQTQSNEEPKGCCFPWF